MSRTRLSFPLILGATVLMVAACERADGGDPPQVLKALESHGFSVVQEFDAGANLRGFAGIAGQQPVAIYVTPDGNAIVGTRLDAEGRRLDEQRLQDLVAIPVTDRIWAQLEASTWVLDGRKDASRIVYTFSDPNCPYCNRFWEATRPWVDSGKVQLRHVLVGMLREDSATKAAAILGAADRSAALLENERKFAQGGIRPARSVPADVRRMLDDNQNLMREVGFRGTPGILYKDAAGLVQRSNGMPQITMMNTILGPR
ncbi:thiol:disulfide interchange protein DsbG [Pectobacterium actinidiae]|uniref:thiol:disulfide interchange protein DsbG n=1 Tax=Pectobacterium actinidiae TaxID=1507808 RepID=UPI00380E57FB